MGVCAQEVGELCTSSNSLDLPQSDKILVDSILGYWFGTKEQPGWDRDTKPSGSWAQRWFSGNKQTDQLIKSKFEHVLDAVKQGILEHWKANKDARLALIILCDQFSRNCYRGTPKSFKFDHFSL